MPMMELERMLERLSVELGEKRYMHSLNTAETAVRLARRYGADEEKAYIAGLLHDCGKAYEGDTARLFVQKTGYQADIIELRHPCLLHGVIGMNLAASLYGVSDQDILSAIRWHTTGKADMTILEKIIYIADFIEPSRDFEGVEQLRREAFRDMNACMLLCADSAIRHVLEKGMLLHPNTVEARNGCMLRLRGAD